MKNVSTILLAAFLNALSFLPFAFALASLFELAGMKFAAAYFGIFFSAALGTFLIGKIAKVPLILFPNYAIISSLIYIDVFCRGIALEKLLLASVTASIIGLTLTVFKLDFNILKYLEEKFFTKNMTPAFMLGVALFLIFEGLNVGKILTASPFAFASIGDMDNPTAKFSLFGITLSLLLYAKYKKYAIIIPVLLIVIFSYIEGYIAIDKIYSPPETFESSFAFDFDFSVLRLILELFFLMHIVSFFFQSFFNKVLGSDKRNKIPLFTTNLISPFCGMFMLTPSEHPLVGISQGAKNGTVSCLTAIFFLIFAFLEPLAESLADFPAIYAPILTIVGVFTVSLVKNLFAGSFAENIAGVAFIALFPITQDIITAFLCSIALLLIFSENPSFLSRFYHEKQKRERTKAKEKLY